MDEIIVESFTIAPTTRKLRAIWTCEAASDLLAYDYRDPLNKELRKAQMRRRAILGR